MENFEAKLAQATAPDTKGGLIGAIGLVVDNKGNTLYHHASGRQSLDTDAPPLDRDSTVALASAGKFITNIAALQLVERGVIGFDEPVYAHLSELEALPLITRSGGDGPQPFTLCTPTKKITLRHLLLHSSGLSDSEGALISNYFADDAVPKPTFPDDAHPLVKHFSMPLIFEPGEGFAYGASIHWTQLLAHRLAGSAGFVGHVRKHVFDALGMASSTYMPRNSADIWDRRLRMVERESDGELVSADDATQGLVCSVSDVGRILSDLVSPSPTLLAHKEHVDLLFEGQFAPGSAALEALRSDSDNYAFCAGKPALAGPPSVNWSAAGLVVEDDALPRSRMPKGTVTWEGMPNVMWAMNRERGVAAFFATQLIPVGDEVANALALAFMEDAWHTFG